MIVKPAEGDLLQPVGTAHGPGRWHLTAPAPGRPRLVLGHGAGGGVDAPDLLAARAAALALGWQVARFEQPWRVRGARVAEAPARLDTAWRAALEALPPAPTVLGGRSAGARVACRSAATPADVPHPVLGVLCLAFPLRPPGRTGDRTSELLAPQVPRLVVQGDRDAFGVPAAGTGLEVHVVAGADHAFAVRRRDGRTAADVHAEVAGVVGAWLRRREAAHLGDLGES